MKEIDASMIPGAVANANKKTTTTVELKNVLFGTDGKENISVEVVPFNPRNDDHVDFAYTYADMLSGAPAAFENISQCARRYVELFMAHTTEDITNENSKFRKVYGDLRASRTLFHQPDMQKALQDFFEPA